MGILDPAEWSRRKTRRHLRRLTRQRLPTDQLPQPSTVEKSVFQPPDLVITRIQLLGYVAKYLLDKSFGPGRRSVLFQNLYNLGRTLALNHRSSGHRRCHKFIVDPYWTSTWRLFIQVDVYESVQFFFTALGIGPIAGSGSRVQVANQPAKLGPELRFQTPGSRPRKHVVVLRLERHVYAQVNHARFANTNRSIGMKIEQAQRLFILVEQPLKKLLGRQFAACAEHPISDRFNEM